MRTTVSLLTVPALLLGLNFPSHGCGGKALPAEKDPWVGTYSSPEALSPEKHGQLPGPRRVTITRDGDGYRLSKPYHRWKFTEVRPGVLADRKGGVGEIYRATARFSDGQEMQVLRFEFCYEHFVLFRSLPQRPKGVGTKGPLPPRP